MASPALLQICLGLVLLNISVTYVASYNPCDGIHEFFPDPLNCSKFYHCDGLLVSHKDCPAGLHWAVKVNRCEYPKDAQCSVLPAASTTNPEPTESEKVPSTEGSQSTKGPKPTEVPKSSEGAKSTPPTPGPVTAPEYNPCDGQHEFFPDPDDCTKFYHCDGYLAYHKDCPANLHWDVITNRCQWPSIAHCGSGTWPTKGPMPTHGPWPTKGPKPTYYPWSTKGPKPTTSVSPPEYNPCDGTTEFFPDPVDCTKFYHCDGFLAYHKDCPSNLYWDVTINRCEWPEIAHCGSSSTVTSNPDKTTPSSETTTPRTSRSWDTTTGSAKTTPRTTRSVDTTTLRTTTPITTRRWDTTTLRTTTPGTTRSWETTTPRTTRRWDTTTATVRPPPTTEPSPYPEFDLCSVHILYADPLNCSNFYYCIDGVPHLRNCPSGKEWNTLTNRCECKDLCGCRKNPCVPSSTSAPYTKLPG